MFLDQAANPVQLVVVETPVLVHSDGFQPEFGDRPVALNVNMNGFSSVRAEEDEAVWSMSMDGWHGSWSC